ncbi:MAG: VOC family protein [Proteobacteria bacterium]|nr:VOC family protein [Pseudomonadota bacterium]
MGVRRLIHVNVVCSNLERSLAFYTEVCGARIATEAEDRSDDFLGAMGFPGGSGYRARLLYFGDALNGPYIDLLEWDVKGGPTPLGPRDTGIPRLALLVEDVDESHAELGERGDVKILGAPLTHTVGSHRVRAFLFEDPDGVLIEFAQFV